MLNFGLLFENTFSYCCNMPVYKIDASGQKPGDAFETEEEAAIDFARTVNGDSILYNCEFISLIVRYTEDGEEKYIYMEPYTSYRAHGVGYTAEYVYKALEMGDIVAVIHTHGAYDVVKEPWELGDTRFSEQDIWYYKLLRSLFPSVNAAYLVACDGKVRCYDEMVRNSETNSLNKNEGRVLSGATGIAFDVRFDPNAGDATYATRPSVSAGIAYRIRGVMLR